MKYDLSLFLIDLSFAALSKAVRRIRGPRWYYKPGQRRPHAYRLTTQINPLLDGAVRKFHGLCVSNIVVL